MWICAVMPCKNVTVEVLDQQVPYYNWTGFYWMNDAKSQLELGAYVGAATDHTSIPYGTRYLRAGRGLRQKPLRFRMCMHKTII